MNKHALVLGASGIQGWAIVNELLKESNSELFHTVTAVTKRPLDHEYSLWPRSSRLSLIHGIDLTSQQASQINESFMTIPDINSVTHVYYCAYQWIANQEDDYATNQKMLQHSIATIDALSYCLQFVVLVTGAKAYGMHLLNAGFPYHDKLPLTEDLPPLPEPYESELLYTAQVSSLKRLAEGKSWTWCEVRPDLVVGFVPNNNPHCLPQTFGIYLTLFAELHGLGSQVPFPGSKEAYNARFVPACQDTIAQFCIFASIHPQTSGNGGAFNVGDRDEPTTWSSIWPTLCALFGLEGTEPRGNGQQPESFIRDNRHLWDEIAKRSGLRSGFVTNDLLNPAIFQFMTGEMNFDRQLSLSRSRRIGFQQTLSENDAWSQVIQRFRDARIIP